MYFFGIQKYEIRHIIVVIAAVIAAGRLIANESPIINVLKKVSQQYTPTIIIEIKKATSQMRRCQKRVNVIDLIDAP